MLPKTGWGNICWVTYSAYVLTMAQKRTQTGRPYRFFRKKNMDGSGAVLKSLVLLVPVTLRSGCSKSSLKPAILRIPTKIDFEGFSR